MRRTRDRSSIETLPTVYSARNTSILKPLADLEAWLYVVLELLNKDAVPWTKKPDAKPEEFLSWKNAFFKGLSLSFEDDRDADPSTFGGLPSELQKVATLLDTKGEEKDVHDLVDEQLRALVARKKINMSGRVEWERDEVRGSCQRDE